MPLCLVNAFAACCTAFVSAVPLEPNISVSGDLVALAVLALLADGEEPNPLPEEQAVASTASPAAATAATAILRLMVSSSRSRGMVRSCG